VNPQTGIITTFAGTGQPGYSGDGKQASKARIGAPSAIDFDSEGNLYFADLTQHVVRKIDVNGIITTVAGTGISGFSPDGTPGTEAKLFKPLGIAVRPDGKVYFSDSRNNRVRTITKDGTLLTVAGSNIAGDAGDGGPAINARLNEPQGLALYGDDVLLISDHYNNRIKAVKL
jgi:sugar lactone lactonase YvrE